MIFQLKTLRSEVVGFVSLQRIAIAPTTPLLVWLLLGLFGSAVETLPIVHCLALLGSAAELIVAGAAEMVRVGSSVVLCAPKIVALLLTILIENVQTG